MKCLPFAFLALVACAPASAQQHDGGRILAQLEKADANKDGAIARSEFIAFRATQFARLDRNRDGVFSDDDLPGAVKNRLPPELSLDTLKASFDANKDGRISESEFTGGPATAFDKLDANGDGTVSKNEMDRARTVLAARQ